MRLAKFWYDRWGWMDSYPGFGWTRYIAERVYARYYADGPHTRADQR